MVDVEAKLARQGIDAHGDVVTSAMAAAGLLQPGERALLVGGPGIREALEARGVEVVLDGDADAVVVGLHLAFAYERMRIAVGRGPTAAPGWSPPTTTPPIPPPTACCRAPARSLAGIERATGAVADGGRQAVRPDGRSAARPATGRPAPWSATAPTPTAAWPRVLGYRWALVLSGVTSSLDPPPDPEPDVVAPTLADLVTSELASR